MSVEKRVFVWLYIQKNKNNKAMKLLKIIEKLTELSNGGQNDDMDVYVRREDNENELFDIAFADIETREYSGEDEEDETFVSLVI